MTNSLDGSRFFARSEQRRRWSFQVFDPFANVLRNFNELARRGRVLHDMVCPDGHLPPLPPDEVPLPPGPDGGAGGFGGFMGSMGGSPGGGVGGGRGGNDGRRWEYGRAVSGRRIAGRLKR